MTRHRLLVGVSLFALTASALFTYAAPLAADPSKAKDCASTLPALPRQDPKVSTVPEPSWSQRGGNINDASCLSRTSIAGIVAIRTENDVAAALAYARSRKLTVSAAGAKHSMGGQAFRLDGIVLDMRGLDSIQLNPIERTITVGGGARWHDIQRAIHPHFAVKAMQSTDIFTVGGSISVNAHGMDHQAGALMGSLRSVRVMLSDGSVVEASRAKNPELFAHVVGGYGLFGVILSATLDVVPNDIYRSERSLIDYQEFPQAFADISADADVALYFAHLSTAPGSFLKEALIYRYRRVPADQSEARAPLEDVGFTKLRRLTINLSKRAGFLNSAKWWAEKRLEPLLEACTVSRAQAMRNGEACLVSRNDTMHDSFTYLQNDLPDETDILQEYFVPRDRIVPFIDQMRDLLRAHDANLINASIRAVGAETNTLSYAPKPAFGIVLYINQKTTAEGTEKMMKLTSDLVDLAAREGGRFFLPYQLHYTPEQLARAYPEAKSFFAAKDHWDPAGLFSNSWHARYAPYFT